MNRLLIFHYHDRVGNNTRMAPSAYYMDAEYAKVAVRIYAEVAPDRDAKVDIFDDGASIFTNHATTHINRATGVRTVEAEDTTVSLPAGQNLDEMAEDFNATPIAKGSLVYCNLVNAGGGKNFTVQLELSQLSEDDERED